MQNTLTTLFIDLDGTVYPTSNGLWNAMSSRIHTYLHEELGIPEDEVVNKREFFYHTYGTTLRGIQAHYEGIDTDAYLKFVHGVPLDAYIKPDPELRATLKNIPFKKWIFTNADRHHAHRVLSKLGIEDLFDGTIDIIDMGFTPKPDPSVYPLARKMAGNPAPENCIFVEDSTKNLETAKELGWKTVLVNNLEDHPAAMWRIPSLHDLPDIINGLT